MEFRWCCLFVLGIFAASAPVGATDERRVSIYKLLADPADLDSVNVVVRGYCCPLGQELGIFPSPSDCSEGNSISGIRLDGSEVLVEKIRGFKRGEICTVKGIFESWEGKAALDTHFENGRIATRLAYPY